MATNPFDPPVVKVLKTLDRAGIGTVNSGYGSRRSSTTRSRPAPPSTVESEEYDLSDLGDVDTITDPPSTGDTLTWDGTQWVAAPIPSPPGAPSDRRWKVGPGEVSIDEFNDGVLDPAWTFAAQASIPALPSLARPRYVEGADVLSVKYGPETGVGAGVADGATNRHHAIVRPLSGIGGSLAVGDGIIAAFNPLVRANASHRMAGLILSTTNASGSGNQLYQRWWTGGSIGMRSLTSWNGDTLVGTDHANALQGTPIYVRIVRLSSTTWRGDFSPDGVTWLFPQTAATWAFEPTHVGFAESNWNTTTPSIVSYEFIRRVSGVS